MLLTFSLCLALSISFVFSSTLVSAQILEVWTFVNTHARFFRALAEDFEKMHGVRVNVQEIQSAVLWDRLNIALQTGLGAPDLVDIEQGAFGRFLKGTIGLEPLNPFLERENLFDAIAEGRQALYTSGGQVYGLEHALTPVVLYYRWDIFADAGVETPLQTWDDYITAGKKIRAFDPDRYMAPLPPFEVLLRQRGGDIFDVDGNLIADNELAIDTLQWVLDTRFVHDITTAPPADAELWAAVNQGVYATLIGADWYAGFIKDNAADTEGKWMAQPLPTWEPGGRNTSTWGGTGLAITKFTKDKNLAWEFVKFAQLNVESAILRYQLTNLYPPLKAAWGDPRLEDPDPFFNGQRLGVLFAEVGANVPPQYNTAFTPEWNNLWSNKYYPEVVDGRMGPAEALRAAAQEVRRLMSGN